MFSIKAEESNAVTKPMASECGSRRLFEAGSMLLSSSAATAGSSLSFVKGMMPKLFISERSLCQFRLPKQSRAKVGFGLEKNTILVACTDGSLYKCSFDPVKREPCRLQQDFYFPEALMIWTASNWLWCFLSNTLCPASDIRTYKVTRLVKYAKWI